MSSNKISTSLPKLPESLRPISPFIQRADELKTKDSVISYWCTCITSSRMWCDNLLSFLLLRCILRRSTRSWTQNPWRGSERLPLRIDYPPWTGLLSLLNHFDPFTYLITDKNHQFKEEIRNESDTKFSFIDKTAAGVAYVEHFALRVFKAADDDDRKGDKGAM